MTEEQVTRFNLFWSRHRPSEYGVLFADWHEWPHARVRHALWLRSRGHSLETVGIYLGRLTGGRLTAERARQVLHAAREAIRRIEGP